MIKFGRARLYKQYEDEYVGTATIEIMLNVVEKTSGSYTEIMVNPESIHYTDNESESDERRATYDVYVGITAEQAVLKYRMSNEELSWPTPLAEV